jgi:SAM-dependent methyltransferase
MGEPAAPVHTLSRGGDYERYVGRWSRLVAQRFLGWLDPPPGCRWLDVGCGTGALSETVLRAAAPEQVIGVDQSDAFVAYAARHVADPRASFRQGRADSLPLPAGAVDVVVSGLMLNFVPDPAAALREMRRVTRHRGTIAAYVWDYAGEMQLMRYFWDAAAELDPAAASARAGARVDFCRPGPLRDLFVDAGLLSVEVGPIVVSTVFPDFDDYWTPFLRASAPAPAYARGLDEAARTALREAIRRRLPVRDDGSIHLTAGAWAVRGYCGG